MTKNEFPDIEQFPCDSLKGTVSQLILDVSDKHQNHEELFNHPPDWSFLPVVPTVVKFRIFTLSIVFGFPSTVIASYILNIKSLHWIHNLRSQDVESERSRIKTMSVTNCFFGGGKTEKDGGHIIVNFSRDSVARYSMSIWTMFEASLGRRRDQHVTKLPWDKLSNFCINNQVVGG